MAINFPSSPNVNDTHTHSGKEWTWNGTSWVLSTSGGGYTLPIATSGALGGIKVGSRLTINAATGVLDADVQASSYGDSDVDTHLNSGGAGSGEILQWNGSDYAWVAQSNTTSFTALTDTPNSYSADQWVKVNAAGNAIEFTTAPAIPNLNAVLGVGNTSSTAATVGDLTCDNLTVNGTQTIINSNTVNIGDNILVLNSDETGTPSQNGGLEIERGTSTNVSLRWNETTDKWQYTNDGTTFSDIGSGGSTYTDGDVDARINTATATSNQLLSWTGTDYAWVADADTNTDNFTGLTDTPSTFTANKWLKVNSAGSALEWTDAPAAGVVTDDTAPASPSDGDLWWDSDSGRLNVYYQDADSSQWVDASPLGAPNIQGDMTGHIIPTSNASYDLGNASYKIRHLFLSDNSLKFGDTQKSLGVSGTGQLQFDGKDLLQNVVLSGLDNNQTIKYNGTNWVNEAIYNDGALDARINTATATSNQLLSWTGSDYDWVDAPTQGPPAFQSSWRIPL